MTAASDAMDSREDLERRVAQLEAEVVRLRSGRRGVRRQSELTFAGWPLYAVAVGADPERGEIRGHAKGVFAFGDIATGVVAFGGLARGFFAFGGLALGLVTFGGLSIGILLAIGGAAIGGVAFGGGAAGGIATGGGAVGYYACGGAAAGHAVVMPGRQDPEAVALFHRFHVGRVCEGR
jgi:hypothetical protein